MAFRAQVGIGLVAAVGVVTLVTLVRARRRRRAPLGAVVALAILTAAAAVNGAVLADRGWAPAAASAAAGTETLIVLSWNTQGGASSPGTVAALVAQTHADIVALPETDREAATEITGILAEQGIVMTAHTVGDWIPTSLLIAHRLGEYRHVSEAGSTPHLPSGVWEPIADAETTTSAPTVVVAHPMPPLPSSMQTWRDGLNWVARQCATLGAGVVIAGDLNATLDHLPEMPGCSDAAQASGAAAWGSWPSRTPAWLASPIDHVLVGEAWRTVGFRMLDADDAGSDHRPIVAVLRRR